MYMYLLSITVRVIVNLRGQRSQNHTLSSLETLRPGLEASSLRGGARKRRVLRASSVLIG